MRARIHGQVEPFAAPHLSLSPPECGPESPAVTELFSAVFRRDLQAFFPRISVEPRAEPDDPLSDQGPEFEFEPDPAGQGIRFRLLGHWYLLCARNHATFSELELRMVKSVATVLTQRYEYLFKTHNPSRMDLYRGGAEDHYIAAFIHPEPYSPASVRASRIAATLHTLRTAALSTYENRRVSTGALLLGDTPGHASEPVTTPADAIAYGVELTAVRSIHRLCDGRRTLFLVDQGGRLIDIVDVARWAEQAQAYAPDSGHEDTLCARAYQPHAISTRGNGHVCLVLSPNQEIKVFAEGRQAFVFSHGRWRILDPVRWYEAWSAAVNHPLLARTLFQAALDMAESRQGGLFVVVRDPEAAIGRLIARHDLVNHVGREDESEQDRPEASSAGMSPLARQALHYLARGRVVTQLDAPVLEAIASLDGALVVDQSGLILAFGAILRHHDAPERLGLDRAEGARTTAALVASLQGPVLKVSEDGIVSFFLDGERVWDL